MQSGYHKSNNILEMTLKRFFAARPSSSKGYYKLCRCSNFRLFMIWRKTQIILKYVLIIVALVIFVTMFFGSEKKSCSESGCRKSGSFIEKFQSRQFRPHSSVKRILLWTGFFGDQTWEGISDSIFKPCQINTCTVTSDRSLVDKSDAILYHAEDLWNFWRGVSLPETRQAFQVWILYNLEAPPNVPLNLAPFGGVFNWTAFYRRDSDVPVSYGGYSKYMLPRNIKLNHSLKTNWAHENNRFSAWMSSNCYDYGRRQLLVTELKKHLGADFDMYGKCGNKRCPETICQDTLSNYKFFFPFENGNCRDYITEKFWATLFRRQVPVVFGATKEEYLKIAPPHSFIHVNDFNDVKSLVDYLYYLSNNETAYNEYLEWTTDTDIYSEVPARRKWWCDLCKALHDDSRSAQVYTDIEGWMQDDVCPQWTLTNQIGRIFDGFKIKIGLL